MLFLLLAGMSCGDENYKYSSYHCNLSIDNSTHLDQTLNSALNAMSPGVFCKISYMISNGATYFVFANNQGANSKTIFNAIDQRLQSQNHIGLNNGLIIGYGNLNDPAEFYAYDAECPNCFSPNTFPIKSYPLSISNNGLATCNHCKRQYNMNTGGNCTNNTGNGLTAYRAYTTGANGKLYVN